MAKKQRTPTKEQADILRRAGLIPWHWEIVKELEYSMIIRHRETGEYDVIDK